MNRKVAVAVIAVAGILTSSRLRFKFNQVSSRTEFAVSPVGRWYANDEVEQATDSIFRAHDVYLKRLADFFDYCSIPGQTVSAVEQSSIRQELDDAAHKYNSLVRLARYFRADYFNGFPQAKTAGQAQKVFEQQVHELRLANG